MGRTNIAVGRVKRRLLGGECAMGARPADDCQQSQSLSRVVRQINSPMRQKISLDIFHPSW